MQDPTLEEMRQFIDALPFASERTEFDREEAIYWFAYYWHGGQTSNLYSALCCSEYAPGPISTGPEPQSMSSDLLKDLEGAFT